MPEKSTHEEMEQPVNIRKEENRSCRSVAETIQGLEKRLELEQAYRSAMHQTAIGLLQHTDLNDLLEAIVTRACSLAGTEHGYLHLYDPGTDELVLKIGLGRLKQAVDFRIKPGQGLAGKIWQNRKMLAVEDYAGWSERDPDPRFDALRAVVGVPLKSNADFVGVIGLAHFEKEKSFGESALEILRQFAEIASLVLSRTINYADLQDELGERKKIETALKRRLEFERIVSIISSKFVAAADVNAQIDASLGSMGRFSEKSRVYLFLLDTANQTMSNTHEWCADGVTPQIEQLQNLSVKAFPWIMPKILDGEIVEIEDVSGLPSEAVNEKKILEMQDIKSLILVPVRIGGKVDGFIGFDDTQKTGPWSADDVALLQVVSDIIGSALQRERTEAALRDSEKRYRALVEDMPAMICRFVPDGTLTFVNNAYCDYFQKKSSDLIGQKFLQFIPQEDRKKVKRHYSSLNEKNPMRTYDHQVIGPDGKMVWQEWTDRVLFNQAGTVSEYQSIGQDITERKLAEAALTEEKERLAVTLRSIGDGVITTDAEGKVTLLNNVAEKLSGWSQQAAIGKPLKEVFHIVDEFSRIPAKNPVQEVLDRGAVVRLSNHTMLISRDGTEYIIADSAAPITSAEGKILGVILVFRDITEKRKMEAELQKIQKLESLGVLAGGIAHDFNNILTGIVGNISLAKMDAEAGKNIVSQLTEIENASLRAKDLTQQLLTFSKGGEPVKDILQIAELTKEAVIFALRGSNVRCRFELPDGLWPLEIDGGQIGQVINNLVLNADQSMPGGGELIVRAKNTVLSPQNNLSLPAGKYVMVSIQDRGIGISRDHLDNIFDPYFSTKQKGSGLGLTIAYSIIDKHSGRLTVESKLGAGSVFSLYLPAARGKECLEPSAEPPLQSGQGKILVMDDEAIIRGVAANMLNYLGYDVTLASDGQEAVDIYRRAMETGSPFDAVILDLTVPGGMGGQDTIQTLKKLDSRVNAIVSSGYSNDPVISNHEKFGFKGIVTKPYRIQEMSEALNKLLG